MLPNTHHFNPSLHTPVDELNKLAAQLREQSLTVSPPLILEQGPFGQLLRLDQAEAEAAPLEVIGYFFAAGTFDSSSTPGVINAWYGDGVFAYTPLVNGAAGASTTAGIPFPSTGYWLVTFTVSGAIEVNAVFGGSSPGGSNLTARFLPVDPAVCVMHTGGTNSSGVGGIVASAYGVNGFAAPNIWKSGVGSTSFSAIVRVLQATSAALKVQAYAYTPSAERTTWSMPATAPINDFGVTTLNGTLSNHMVGHKLADL